MAAHGFDRRVTVHARREAGADRNHDRRVRDTRAQVLFRENGVHERVRLERFRARGLRVHEHRDTAALRDFPRLGGVLRKTSLDSLDHRRTVAYRLGKAHRPADGGRLRQVGHDDFYSCAVQSERDPRRDVARAANDSQHLHLPYRCFF